MRYLYLLCIYLGFSIASQSVWSAACLIDDAEAIWTMDANTNDQSGNNHNAQGTTSTSLSTDAIKGTGSLAFSGGRGVQYSDGLFFNRVQTALSISLFIKADSLNGVQYLYEEGGGVFGFALRINNGEIEGVIRRVRNVDGIVVRAPLADDQQWHHIVLTFDSSAIRLYLDGELATATAIDATALSFHTSAGGLGSRFGQDAFRDSAGDAGFIGLMDEITYYERALTRQEVRFIAGENGCEITLNQQFSPAVIQAGEVTDWLVTLTNPTPEPANNIEFDVALSNAIWLDNNLQTSCTSVGLTGNRGESTFRLDNIALPANSRCEIRIPVRSNVTGNHAISIENITTPFNEPPQVNLQSLNVFDSQTAVCTPGNGASGSIFMNVADDIYSINLQTAKATLVTTSNLVAQLNSLAINPQNYLLYYAQQGTANDTIFYYDLINNEHGVVAQAPGLFDGLLGGNLLNSGGGSFYNGSLYLGIEGNPQDEDAVVRIVMSADGRTALYANTIIRFDSNEYGDLVVTGDKINFFTRSNTTRFRRFDLKSLQEELDIPAPAVQGGAQRDGTTIWNVGTALGTTNINTGAITTYRPITTDGNSNPGNAFDAAGCVPATNRISGFVYTDTNGNGIKDANEAGIANVTLDLFFDINNDNALSTDDDVAPFTTGVDGIIDEQDRIQQVTTDNNGFYQFQGLGTDNFLVLISDTADQLQQAEPTFQSTDNNQPVQSTSLGLLDNVSDLNFGYQRFIDISGQVFNDNGFNDPQLAHNGIVDAGEQGLADITLTINNLATGDTLCETQTNNNGFFQCLLDYQLSNTDIIIKQQLPSGFIAVNEAIGNTNATQSSVVDSEIVFNTQTQFGFSAIRFANVKQNTFAAQQQATVSAGGFYDYPHSLSINSSGDLSFNLTATTEPQAQWNQQLYLDQNCNAILDGSESTPVSQIAALTTGQTVCVIARVTSPSNVGVGARHRLTIEASFDYINSPQFDSVSLVNQTQIAGNQLTLLKSVENLTQGGVMTQENNAKPGDILRYRIRFINTTDNPIQQLRIKDQTPDFTALKDTNNNGIAIECPDLSGTDLTRCTVNLMPTDNTEGYQGPFSWEFTGQLNSNQQAEAYFDVQIE